MSPPKASALTSKEKMKQMRLPFAPIQKENAILKQKEEQEKEKEKVAEEKQKKLEADRIAKEEELRQWAEEEAKKQRKEIEDRNKENQLHDSQSTTEDLSEKKRKMPMSAEKNEVPSKKANTEINHSIEDLSLKSNQAYNKIAREQQKERERIEKLEEKQKERMSKETLKAEKERLKKEKEEEKEKQKKEKEEEKERLRKEKEEEKDKLRKEKEEEKERQRMEKEEERERSKKEKEEKEERYKREKAEKEERHRREKEEKEKQRKEKEQEKERLEKIEKDKQAKSARVLENFFIKSPTQLKINVGVNNAVNKMLNVNTNKKNDECRSNEIESLNTHLSLFNVKKNMRLAPISRIMIKSENRSLLESILADGKWEDSSKLYLSNLKSIYNPSKQGKTWPIHDRCKFSVSNACVDDYDTPMTEEDDEEEKTALALLELDGDSIVDIPEVFRNKEKKLENEADGIASNKNNTDLCRTKAKLLQFHTNERPPYWGTWSKTSNKIGPRRPFSKDSDHLDYEYDSDDDWEEEEHGESLSDEEKDQEDEQMEDEDDDDGFFVGHGVLDKDEAHLIESDEENSQKNDTFSLQSKEKLEEDLEIKKMKLRAEQFEEEYKRQKSMPPKLKPRVFGCFWKSNFDVASLNDFVPKQKIIHDKLMNILKPHESVILDYNEQWVVEENYLINTSYSIRVKQSPSSKTSDSAATPKVGENLDASCSLSSKKTPGRQKAKIFPEDATPDLIQLVHGNSHNKIFLVKEFSAFLQKMDKNGGKKDNEKDDSNETLVKEDCEDDAKDLEVPKTKIVAKIQEIADYKRWPDTGRMANKMCWIVKPEVLADPKWKIPDIKDLEENGSSWSYILEQPKNVTSGRTPSVNELSEKENGIKSNSASPSNTPKRKAEDCSNERLCDKRSKSPAPSLLITKFAKILTPEDRIKQMTKLREKAEAEREEANRLLQEKLSTITKELVDEKSMFSVGDLVWGTMKGFPAWPGKIVIPPDTPDLKRPGVKKLLHCIRFFGTYDYAWLAEQDVKPYLQFKESLSKGSKAQNFQRALRETDEFILGKKLIDGIKQPINVPECKSQDMEDLTALNGQEDPKAKV